MSRDPAAIMDGQRRCAMLHMLRARVMIYFKKVFAGHNMQLADTRRTEVFS